MDNNENNELEIDIVAWSNVLKKHLAVVIGITLLFTAAAGIYVYKIADPVYSYVRFINCPGSLSDKDKLTFVSAFKNNSNYQNAKKENSYAALTDVKVVNDGKDRFTTTNLIQFSFEGNNPAFIKKFSDTCVTDSLKDINDYITEIYEITFSREYLTKARREITALNTFIAQHADANADAEGAVNYLTVLKKRLEDDVLTKAYKKADIMNTNGAQPKRISQKPLVYKSAALGLFLSILYITCRYRAEFVKKA